MPEGKPELIKPSPIPDVELKHVTSLSVMPSQYVAWWEAFKENQFHDSYGDAPSLIAEDFFLEKRKDRPAIPMDESISSEEEEERNIKASNHPKVLQHLDFGDLVAVKEGDSFFIGKVTEINIKSRTTEVQVFNKEEGENYQTSSTTVTVNFSSIIHSGFELTNAKKLKKKDEIRILPHLPPTAEKGSAASTKTKAGKSQAKQISQKIKIAAEKCGEPEIKEEWVVGEMVYVYFSDDDYYYLGTIEEVDPEMTLPYLVVFLADGTQERYSCDELFFFAPKPPATKQKKKAGNKKRKKSPSTKSNKKKKQKTSSKKSKK
jgi:hypothetical protein